MANFNTNKRKTDLKLLNNSVYMKSFDLADI